MKEFPNATKPFWRFRANVLKRFICTGFPNDAPTWCDKQGDEHVQFIQTEPLRGRRFRRAGDRRDRIFRTRRSGFAAAVSVFPAADRSSPAASAGCAAG